MMMANANNTLYIFDVDDTLVERYSTDLLPGVAEWFAQNPAAKVAFATNQGGVGLRYWMEKDGFGNPQEMGLPTACEVWQRLDVIADSLGKSDAVRLAAFAYQSKKTGEWGPTPVTGPSDKFYSLVWSRPSRKPSPALILYAMSVFSNYDRVIVVGNSDDDKAAAEAANAQVFIDVSFVHANEFFNTGG